MDDFIVLDMKKSIPLNTGTKYDKIIRQAFYAHWSEGVTDFIFSRDEIDGTSLGIPPKNIGDIIYSFRYRKPLPADILSCAPEGSTWVIEGAGDALYRFRVVKDCWFDPDPAAPLIVLSDHTPDEVLEHGKRDEQAILASISYNRLLDIFLWCRLERKQSHWRTKVTGIGQIEIDDVYIGTDGRNGNSVVVTVQAKRDKDRVNAVQIMQDIRACQEKQDGRICRPVSVHYDSTTGRYSLMEFQEVGQEIELIRETHYLLQKRLVLI